MRVGPGLESECWDWCDGCMWSGLGQAMVTFSVWVKVEFGLWLGIQGLSHKSGLRLTEGWNLA